MPSCNVNVLTRYASAKINLGLHVLRKRADGYHDIETVFLPIGWTDRLTFEPADTIHMTCSDQRLPVDASNLCMKAALALADEVGERAKGVHIHLDKHIPYGAGLGGGSSNAAAALKGCAACWEITDVDLKPIAARLGADVSFFLDRRPCVATGIGERLEPLTGFEANWTAVVVVPDVHVSTAEAYANVEPDDRNRVDLKQVVIGLPVSAWRDVIKNDFEAGITARYPVIHEVRDELYAQGAVHAAMSGSGSAVYGLFEIPAEPAYMHIRRQFPRFRTWMGAVTS